MLEKIIVAAITASLTLGVVAGGVALLDGLKSVTEIAPYIEYAEEVVGAEDIFAYLEEVEANDAA